MITSERREQFSKETIKARELAEKVRKEEADEFAKKYISIIREKIEKGCKLTKIADDMNNDGHLTRRGVLWTDQTVRQILNRFPKEPTKKKIEPKIEIKITPPLRRIIGWDKIR